jgi:hypothetical protein
MVIREHIPGDGVPLYRKLAALAAVAGALAAPAPAAAKILVSTYNEGLEPHAVLQGHSAAVSSPKKIRVEFSSSFQAQLTGRFKIKCDRNFSHSYSLSGVSPAVRVVRLGGRGGQCRVASASARYADSLLQGWIQIRAWGK